MVLAPTLMAVHGSDEERVRPNVVLIMADDLGYECIGANGGVSYQTPNIDKLADSGMRFDSCHAQPVCTPSRVKIMTGKSNARNYVKFAHLDRSQRTFAHEFQDAGYVTAVVGKWQLGHEDDSPIHFGFDEAMLWQHREGRTLKGQNEDTRFANPWLQQTHRDENGKVVTELKQYTGGQYGPQVLADYACDFIERSKDKPFLLYYPMLLTHCPFGPTPDSADWDPKSNGITEYKGDAKYFPEMMSYTDKIVGQVVAKLEEAGIRDNTLLIFTGDNGTDNPVVSKMHNGTEVVGSKRRTIDWGTNVPFIASMPSKIKSRQANDNLIDFSDIYPTICEMAGVEINADGRLDGVSFYPQLIGEEGNVREWLYCFYAPSGPNGKMKKIWARNHDYKLYDDGSFFNLAEDIKEVYPLELDDMTEVQRDVMEQLGKVIAQFEQ